MPDGEGPPLGNAIDAVSLTQFLLDLNDMNQVDRLADGSVPLVRYLRNIAAYLRRAGKPEAEIFERCANDVENKTQGVTRFPLRRRSRK